MIGSFPRLQLSQSTSRGFDAFYRHQSLWRIFVTLLAFGLIIGLWLQNFRRVYVYDYSLVSYANAYLQRGMQPYRDFGTPLQTLTYYLAYISEGIFGRRYLALGYSNLIATYFLFGTVVLLARQSLPYLGAILLALCVCIATTLQNGILWYNALGILLLAWVTFCASEAICRRQLTAGYSIFFAILFLATGTLKLNYHCANVAIVAFCLVSLLALEAISVRRFAVLATAAAVWAVVAPVCWELLLTGASFSTWKLNVIVRASGRAHDLALVESRNFWLGTVREFYLGNPFAGTFALGLLCYVAASIIWIYYERSRSHDRKLRFLVLAITGIWMFFALSVLLGVTNVDLESTAASLLPIGLLGLCLAFGLKIPSRRIIGAIALAFSLWLGWRGLYSIHRHSRLLIPTQVLWYQNTYTVNEGYLKGALLCKLNAQQLSDAQRIVSHFQTIAGSSEIYWGPGTEMFYRQFRTTPLSGFPLWYSPVTVSDQDTGAIVTRLQASPVRVFVADPFWYNIFVPVPMKLWLQTHWTPSREGTLIEFSRPRDR